MPVVSGRAVKEMRVQRTRPLESCLHSTTSIEWIGCVPLFVRMQINSLADESPYKQMRKQFDRNDRSHVVWLDNAVKEKVYKLCDELEADLVNKGLIFLLIELPSFEYPVVFREEGVRPTDLGLAATETSSSVYLIMPDPEMTVDINPVENKHRIITYRRRRRRGLLDKDVQPNAAERKQIIVRLPVPV